MTAEEADVLLQIMRGDGNCVFLRDLTVRNRRIAQRLAMNTNYVRLVDEDIAAVTQPGLDALARYVRERDAENSV